MATRKELLYEDALNNIWGIGMDYDGARTVDELKSLVDNLIDIATDALQGKSPLYIREDGVFNCFFEQVGEIDEHGKVVLYNPERNDLNDD